MLLTHYILHSILRLCCWYQYILATSIYVFFTRYGMLEYLIAFKCDGISNDKIATIYTNRIQMQEWIHVSVFAHFSIDLYIPMICLCIISKIIWLRLAMHTKFSFNRVFQNGSFVHKCKVIWTLYVCDVHFMFRW